MNRDLGLLDLGRVHPAADDIGARLCQWAARVGLITTAADEQRLRGAGFHEVSALVMPDDSADTVELYARWITVLFHLDDEQDDDAERTPEQVHELYAAITAIMQGRPVLVASPLVSALTDLWPRTMAGMTARWRERVIAHLHRHRDASLAQIAHREAGTLPTPEEYPVLRREANGMFMFDIIESACGTEVPDELARSEAWKELCESSNDLTAWCNDIRSLAKEAANDEPTNFVTVLRHARGCSEQDAVAEVENRIRQRQKELVEATRRVRVQITDQPRLLQPRLGHLTTVISHIPGGHAAWLDTSARYREAG
ncbi:terpene synthase family protein [Saccharopolyspora flava]|uniref:Terpene synthase n=1 Tax=Saccharopolyspora flava TaxID=95161 RepID=A0A1I6V2K3_9PSEU|nr:terpene synthase family protein [Saccharopolyspora flava]SFT07787.1 hypothetical protein SAMN05660874_05511 [Saccharopolyspora flava]